MIILGLVGLDFLGGSKEGHRDGDARTQLNEVAVQGLSGSKIAAY